MSRRFFQLFFFFIFFFTIFRYNNGGRRYIACVVPPHHHHHYPPPAGNPQDSRRFHGHSLVESRSRAVTAFPRYNNRRRNCLARRYIRSYPENRHETRDFPFKTIEPCTAWKHVVMFGTAGAPVDDNGLVGKCLPREIALSPGATKTYSLE